MGYQLHDKNFVMQSVFHNHKSFVIKTVTQLPAIREILKQKLELRTEPTNSVRNRSSGNLEGGEIEINNSIIFSKNHKSSWLTMLSIYDLLCHSSHHRDSLTSKLSQFACFHF